MSALSELELAAEVTVKRYTASHNKHEIAVV